MDKPKVLVVDDEPINIKLMMSVLKRDYEVITAYNGNEALKQVEYISPDLILLDIMMPGVDGYKVCSLLKDNEKTMSIPVIMVTALAEKEDRIKALKIGADDFMTKPIDIEIVYAKINSLLRVKNRIDNLKSLSKVKLEFFILDNHKLLTTKSNQDGLSERQYQNMKSNPFIEDIVKSHIEIIILSILSERSMCGFELIKEIITKYNVLLSQGTVYPYLYSLKETGILKTGFIKGDMRSKIYSLTQEGKQLLSKKLEDFIQAEKYVINSI